MDQHKTNGHAEDDDPDLAELYAQAESQNTDQPTSGIFTFRQRIEGKFQFYQTRADMFKLMLKMFDEDLGERKGKTAQRTMLQQAMKIDSERREKQQRSRTGPHSASAIRARRAATLAFINTLSRTKPQQIGARAGLLARVGLIEPKGDGWVRSAKPYSVEPEIPPSKKSPLPERKQTSREDNAAVRAATAKRLAKMSMDVPKHYGSGAGILMQHGYLAKKGDGWVRTSKPYTP